MPAGRLPRLIISAAWLLLQVDGHGRLMDPPARNSMWRFGFPNPVNYNDNELFCGGYAVQWEQNNGSCGLCGDPYHVDKPRPHEAGGMFAKGIITRRYSVGQEIDIEVELTANHQGRFEMHLCPVNNPTQEATPECFERHPLFLAGTKDQWFHIPEESQKKEIFKYQVRLPPYVTCSQCVLRWTYYTGNMWGLCSNGTEAQGCGKSEQFKNCADISILTSTGGAVPPLFVQDNPFLLYFRDLRYAAPYNVQPLVIRDQVCLATGIYRIIPGMSQWCQDNCLAYPPNCPRQMCMCPQSCEAVGELEGVDGADVYCLDQCLVYRSTCPARRCRCFE